MSSIVVRAAALVWLTVLGPIVWLVFTVLAGVLAAFVLIFAPETTKESTKR